MRSNPLATNTLFVAALFTALIPGLSAQVQVAGPNSPQVTPPSPNPTVGPKQAGIVRIGVALPKTQTTRPTPGSSDAEALRAVEVRYLRGPHLEIIPIAAMIPFQINAEAKEKDCDYILYSDLAEKTPSSSGGFLKRAMPLASMLPMAGALGSAGGIVAASASSVAIASAASLSSDVKAKSEMSLTYKLVSMTNGAEKPVLENSLKGKAKQDGEDIVSPLVEQEATAIVTLLSNKK